jgi:hypothetical protein
MCQRGDTGSRTDAPPNSFTAANPELEETTRPQARWK